MVPSASASRHPRYLGESVEEPLLGRPYSEHTQRLIDQEIARLLREAEQRAIGLLRTHRVALDRLASTLREKEKLDGSVVLAILEGETAHNSAPADA